MSTKGFIMLVVGVLAFGAGLGGSFLAGTIVGSGTEEGAAVEASPLSSASETFAQIREQLQSGQASQEDLAALRQQFQGQAGAGGFTRGRAGGGFGGPSGTGGTLFGVVSSIEGNVVTLDTPQGQLQVTVGSDTTITQTVEAAIADLSEGMQLTVGGERAEDGDVDATFIRVVPVGNGGFGGFVRGGFRGDHDDPGGGSGGGTNGGGS